MDTSYSKRNIVIALILLVAVIVGIILIIRYRSTPETVTPLPEVDWDSKTTEVATALTAAFPDLTIAERSEVSIASKEELTGDSQTEALVFTGTGGASTDILTLVQIKDEVVRVLKWKKKDGTIAPVQLIEGAAALYDDSVGTSPSEDAIYQGSVVRNGDGEVTGCTLDAYKWNSITELFEYDTAMSESVGTDYCEAMSRLTI